MKVPAAILALLCTAGAGAVTPAPTGFDPVALSPAIAAADAAGIVDALRRRLPAGYAVAASDGAVVALAGSRETAAGEAARIARIDGKLRRRLFPDLAPRPVVVVAARDRTALPGLARALYPGVGDHPIPADGFHHPRDGLVLTASDDHAGLLRGLTRLRLREAHPEAPAWFEEAMGTLYERAEERDDRLVPLLGPRMGDIPPGEDLSYDVFAGICDCAPITAEQLALMRLLLVFLDDRSELRRLLASVAREGRYTTLLQALDAMGFDGTAWKAFAEARVREQRG